MVPLFFSPLECLHELYARFQSKFFHRYRLLPILCALSAAFTLQSVPAAPLAEPDRALLAAQAKSQGGLSSVMLTLENLSLESIKARGVDAIRADMEKKADALRAQLGAEALEAGYWNNGMGQVGMLVTANGLRMLERSEAVKAIQPDTTRNQRDRAWVREEDRKAIENSLRMLFTNESFMCLSVVA